ncbi:Signal transduction histidine-protein kinase ArlS [Frankliniella fusca]|uniref:Signal transduction histidine-protein kinase ArlS n=1 Tax=Frankliniella fusca TaxID=407009 RepID=A0AAE1I015_9NEOP|nr:Signal transduction histidine-protein kinase ArlS [Frankliniella fusca]
MSIFQKLKAKVNDHVTKISPDQLTRGWKYPVSSFKTRRSDYMTKNGTYPDNLLAYIKINNLNYYTCLPAVYNDQNAEAVDEMNSAINEGKIPFIVFYGKDGKRNHIVVHEFGEELDKNLLKKFDEKMEGQENSFNQPSTSKDSSSEEKTPQKRTSEGHTSQEQDLPSSPSVKRQKSSDCTRRGYNIS